MKKIEWRKFYGHEPIQPLSIKKYILDDGTMKDTRQMTYECWYENDDTKEVVGMYPTFEIDDVVTCIRGKRQIYCINRYERDGSEILVELLDSDFKRTGKTLYMEPHELMHVVKDVEWI